MVSYRLTGTPVAGFILIHPGVNFKSVKGNALVSDGDLCQIGPNVGIEAVSVHAQVKGCISEADESWEHAGKTVFVTDHAY